MEIIARDKTKEPQIERLTKRDRFGRQIEVYRVKLSHSVSVAGEVKKIQRERTFGNFERARRWKIATRAELEQLATQGPNKTFGDIEDEFFKHFKESRRQSTFARQVGTIRTEIFRPLNDVLIRSFSQLNVEEYIRKSTEGKEPRTKRELLGFFRRIFEYARVQRFVAEDPCEKIKLAGDRSDKKRRRKNRKVLSVAQATILLSYLWEHDQEMFFHVALAIYTGARAGELRGLMWQDIDLEKSIIYITKSLDPKHGWGPPKDDEPREIPICAELHNILLTLRRQSFSHPESMVLPYWRPFWSNEQAAHLKRICTFLGLPRVKFHQLRATLITELFSQGIPVHQIMIITGHNDLETMEEYLCLSGMATKGATDRLKYMTGSNIDTDGGAKGLQLVDACRIPKLPPELER